MPGDAVPAPLSESGVTRREAEVLAALGDRLTNAQVAERLYVSERTVESHVASLLRKLSADDRVELAEVARGVFGTTQAIEPRRQSPLPALMDVLVNSSRFVGRVTELGRLHELWARSEAGQLQVGVIAGPAGMGKSRLVAEFATEVHRAGARVQWTACVEDVRVPYQPFVQAITADVTTMPKGVLRRRLGAAATTLARLVPELRPVQSGSEPPEPPDDGAVDPASAQTEVSAALHTYLARTADKAPLLFVIEDIHWATSTTLAALRHLAWEGGPARALILATTRDTAPDLDDELTAFLADLTRLPSVERLDVTGLVAGEVAVLIDSLGGSADPAHAAVVAGDTGGNPLLIREVAGDSGGRAGTLPSLLARRYALLDKRDLDVLDLAAVLGPSFDVGVLAAAARRPVADVAEALERAERAGLVSRSSADPAEVSFLHALFSTARYDQISEAKRKRLHRAVVAALQERAEDLSVLGELARHAALAGPTKGHAAAGRALRRAGDRDLGLNDFTAARRAFQGALSLLPADDPERPAVLLGLGRALLTTESSGADVLTEARDAMLAEGNVEAAAEAEMMLGELDWWGSQLESAAGHFAQAAALVADRPASVLAARVFVDLARRHMIVGDSEAARRCGARALSMARALGVRAFEADVLLTIGPARVGDGDLGGIDDIRRGVQLAEDLNSPSVGRGYGNLAYAHGLIGDIRACHEWRAKAKQAAARYGLLELDRWARAHDIEHAWYVGRWDDALAEAEAFIRELEPAAYYLVAVALRVRGRVRLGRGNRIGALADAAASLEFARGASHPSNLLVALPFSAFCLVEAGRYHDANVAVDSTIEAGRGKENILDPIQLAIVMWRLGRAPEFLEVGERATIASRRWEVGRRIASGDLRGAADMLAALEHRSFEAYVRLLAADHGRHQDAQSQLERARDFYRSVGATAYLRPKP